MVSAAHLACVQKFETLSALRWTLTAHMTCLPCLLSRSAGHWERQLRCVSMTGGAARTAALAPAMSCCAGSHVNSACSCSSEVFGQEALQGHEAQRLLRRAYTCLQAQHAAAGPRAKVGAVRALALPPHPLLVRAVG